MLIGKKEKKILNILLENSRLSFREIAKKTGISVVTVINKVKKLQQEKIIKSYTTEINYEKIGYDVQVIINIKAVKGKLSEMEKKLSMHPNIFAVYDTTGDFDALVIAKFKTRKKLDYFLKNLQTYDFILKTKTKLILNILKEKNILIE